MGILWPNRVDVCFQAVICFSGPVIWNCRLLALILIHCPLYLASQFALRIIHASLSGSLGPEFSFHAQAYPPRLLLSAARPA